MINLKPGDVSGRLTLTRFAGKEREKLRWWARCECGNEIKIIGSHFNSGRVKSCGCLRNELNRTRHVKHGQTHTKTWVSWQAMRYRCSSENPHYGGRGIKVCERWKTFDNFLADMGEKPTDYTLERLDVNADYTPENCVWLHYSHQMQNTRVNAIVVDDGELICISEALRRHGIRLHTFYNRWTRGVDHQLLFDNLIADKQHATAVYNAQGFSDRG